MSDSADPNNDRCLVENTSSNCGIEYCRMIPKSMIRTNPSFLDSLEFAWDIQKGTLDLDSRSNIFAVGISLSKIFRRAQWILLPDKDTVQTYYENLDSNFPKIKSECFVYRMFPVQRMDDVILTRQNVIATPLSEDMVTTHVFPFDTLPDLVSHVHPMFVIVRAGYVLVKTKYPLKDPLLQKIVILFQKWTAYAIHHSVASDSNAEQGLGLDG
ncbi:hypothetical protein BDQ17DRAFT_1422298 [Cyathus striatus]|nr:hypothetical protein BDQ17DRAFT_1422298 [Cyathus striatus]